MEKDLLANAKDFENDVNPLTEGQFKEQEVLMGKSLHKIPSVFEDVLMEGVVVLLEWQPRQKTDPTRLLNSLCLEGLATPPKVVVANGNTGLDNGVMYAIDARHRWASLEIIKETRPDVWEHHGFADGIPCQIYKDLTDDQILDLRTDEGRGQEPLAGKVEAFRALLPHYEAGKSDRQIQEQYWKILADSCCSKQKSAELYDKFSKAESAKDFQKAVNNATRIHQQRFRWLFDVPMFIRQAWIDGMNGAMINGAIAPKVIDSILRECARVHKAEAVAGMESDPPKTITREEPGVGVVDLYNRKMAEAVDKANSGDQVTPMSKTDKENHAAHGKSHMEKAIFSAILGNDVAKTKLPALLLQMEMYDKAMSLDHLTVEGLLMAVIAHTAPLKPVDRQRAIDVIQNAKVVAPKAEKDVDVKEKPTKAKTS